MINKRTKKKSFLCFFESVNLKVFDKNLLRQTDLQWNKPSIETETILLNHFSFVLLLRNNLQCFVKRTFWIMFIVSYFLNFNTAIVMFLIKSRFRARL